MKNVKLEISFGDSNKQRVSFTRVLASKKKPTHCMRINDSGWTPIDTEKKKL